MLNIFSYFNLKTSVKDDAKNKVIRNGACMVLTYEIDAEPFN